MRKPTVRKELEAWKLTSYGPWTEALVKKSLRFHVDEARYKAANGDYRSVVKLEVLDEDDHEFDASGVLIGLDLVLTAAHNVRDRGGDNNVSRAVSIKAYIGYHRQGSSFEGTGVQQRFGRIAIVLQEWKRSEFASQNDMALIKLENKFTQVTPAVYQVPSLPVETRVLVVGYPGENKKQVRGSCPRCQTAGCMYEVAGEAKQATEKLLEYKLSTVSGNSGGPIFLDKMPRTVIATHTGAVLDRVGINHATLVDVDFIEATKTFLSIPHSCSHRHVRMSRQGGSRFWSISLSIEVIPGITTPMPSRSRNQA
ncbi:uncharacterized protein J4E87_003032 [Alternaria ethzedia]|uniref:uncharacterized protein n=1 Tax=Alternaria ethzedia TaxID=181014 RepID=UPI0020C38D48|nr:uncharacterized protein J4E87_003032 [Alternaria ethzedia]KAI4629845.1 hypothetical protein J4E87_003032 [Alternaria ethzedia]